MKILLTAFEPFGGEKINPSALCVEKVTAPEGTEIEKILLPVSYEESFCLLKDAVERFCPDAVLLCGQAGGRGKVTIEKIAVNCVMEGTDRTKTHLIDLEGPDGIFSSLPVELLALCDEQCEVSYSAGIYVCNYLLYQSLCYCKKRNLTAKVAFVHFPYCEEQIADKPDKPYLPLSRSADVLQKILCVTAKECRFGLT